jgi:hypothetical protein
LKQEEHDSRFIFQGNRDFDGACQKMKSVALSAILAAGSIVEGYVLQPKTNKIDWKLEQKRQIIGTLTSLMGSYFQIILEEIVSRLT